MNSNDTWYIIMFILLYEIAVPPHQVMELVIVQWGGWFSVVKIFFFKSCMIFHTVLDNNNIVTVVVVVVSFQFQCHDDSFMHCLNIYISSWIDYT